MRKRVLVVFGTRPEVVKLAPVIQALHRSPGRAEVITCCTGQHRQLLLDSLRTFDIRPDYDLQVMREDQHPTDLWGRLLLGLRPVVEAVRPDVVVVQGDTSSVAAGAMAGFAGRAQVAHVEAGLRTHDKYAPFPEEINRRIAGVVTDYHFAPTRQARSNLLAEGVSEDRVWVTGNTVVDALQWLLRQGSSVRWPEELDAHGSRLLLLTAHRRENLGEPLRDICLAVRDLVTRFKDVVVVYPVHLNPRVREVVYDVLADCPRVRLIEPVEPGAFVSLLSQAYLVLTDSGGLQEEGPILGKPVLVLRERTERGEAVQTGVVKVVGSSRSRIVAETSHLLEDTEAYRAAARPAMVYGDGQAADRIAEVLLNGGLSMPEFLPDAPQVSEAPMSR